MLPVHVFQSQINIDINLHLMFYAISKQFLIKSTMSPVFHEIICVDNWKLKLHTYYKCDICIFRFFLYG